MADETGRDDSEETLPLETDDNEAKLDTESMPRSVGDVERRSLEETFVSEPLDGTIELERAVHPAEGASQAEEPIQPNRPVSSVMASTDIDATVNPRELTL